MIVLHQVFDSSCSVSEAIQYPTHSPEPMMRRSPRTPVPMSHSPSPARQTPILTGSLEITAEYQLPLTACPTRLISPLQTPRQADLWPEPQSPTQTHDRNPHIATNGVVLGVARAKFVIFSKQGAARKPRKLINSLKVRRAILAVCHGGNNCVLRQLQLYMIGYHRGRPAATSIVSAWHKTKPLTSVASGLTITSPAPTLRSLVVRIQMRLGGQSTWSDRRPHEVATHSMLRNYVKRWMVNISDWWNVAQKQREKVRVKEKGDNANRSERDEKQNNGEKGKKESIEKAAGGIDGICRLRKVVLEMRLDIPSEESRRYTT
ncbi:hypothetical protein RRG08_062589 [Elysia crispata]|uniref:Uncharacterized protein n=1 Tax=Elysia crispata TaxID=231223 RepID=A0AAE0YYL7_9GAST|nr:hypothetical protein RRG08_062589 [Elysia crispata]